MGQLRTYSVIVGLLLSLIPSFTQGLASTDWKAETAALIDTHPDSALTLLLQQLDEDENIDGKAYIHAKLSQSFRFLRQYDSAFVHASKSERLLRSDLSDYDQFAIHEELMNLSTDQNDFEKALLHAQKALDIQFRSGSAEETINALLSLAFVYHHIDNQVKAMMTLQTAADLAQENHLQSQLGQVFMNMGNILAIQNMLLESIEKNSAAMDIFESMGSASDLLKVWSNLGLLYQSLEQHRASIHYLSSADSLAQILGAHQSRAQILSNLGAVYLEAGNLDSAKVSLSQSLQLSTDLRIFMGVLMNHRRLSTLHNKMENYEQALIHGQQAKAMMSNKPLPLEKIFIEKCIYEAYEGLGNNKLALEAFKQMTTLKDSLETVEKHEQFLEINTRYETEKKAQEIKALQKEKELQAAQTRFLATSLGSVILILGLALLMGLQRTRLLRVERTIAEREKNALATEVKLKNRELEEYARSLAEMSALADSLKADRESQGDNEALDHLLETVNPESGKFTWTELEKRFCAVYPGFKDELNRRQETLTPAQLKLAMLIRMDISNKEIAHITNKSIRTVETTRFALRKKLGLEKYESLGKALYQL